MERLALTIAVILIATGCSAESSSSPQEITLAASKPSTSVTATEAVASSAAVEPTPAERCAEQLTGDTVESFIAAYTNGDPDLTDRFFADEGKFQWYSEPPDRLHEAAHDRASLDQYLSDRHAEGDRLRLVELNHNGYRSFDKTGHFDFSVRRNEVDDVIGKGAIDCLSGGIMVWSLGPNPGPTGT